MELIPCSDLKNCTRAIAVVRGRSIEVAVVGKDQRRTRVRAVGIVESVHGDKPAGRCDLENVAVAIASSIECSTVEIAVGTFNQPGVWSASVGASGPLCAEAMDRSERAPYADLIDCAMTISSPSGSRSISFPISRLHESGVGLFTVGTICQQAETVKDLEHARLAEFENCAFVMGSVISHAVEVTIAGFHQRHRGYSVVTGAGRAKAIKCSKLAPRGDPVDRA